MSLPPAQPAYVLRGHAAQIHSTTFVKANTRLVTGDADGWIVIWSLSTKRPVAVWKAHEGAILGTAAWAQQLLISHGKDNKLIVWKLTEDDEALMSTILPVEDSTTSRKQPWLLHVLPVNTLNFCSFASCTAQKQSHEAQSQEIAKPGHPEELLIAVPNTLTSESVDIFHMPSEKRIHTVSGDRSAKTGMVMAVSIFYSGTNLTVVAGYESGHTIVTQLVDRQSWHILYMSKPHSQPILSLAVDSKFSFYITSSADAIIAKHPIPTMCNKDISAVQHELYLSTDSAKSVISGHSLLSMGLDLEAANSRATHPQKVELQTTPIKVVQTKHSGQQGLRIRSDDKILATAGWDSRVRVYSVQSLKELAVLKWHKEGCYAVAFANVNIDKVGGENKKEGGTSEEGIKETTLLPLANALTVKGRRDLKATMTHWLAAGSKDGKSGGEQMKGKGVWEVEAVCSCWVQSNSEFDIDSVSDEPSDSDEGSRLSFEFVRRKRSTIENSERVIEEESPALAPAAAPVAVDSDFIESVRVLPRNLRNLEGSRIFLRHGLYLKRNDFIDQCQTII